MERKFLFFALSWTLLIAVLSLATFDKTPSISIPHKDKYVHFVFYFVLTLSWMLSFKQINNQLLFKIIALIFLYGTIIEALQGIFTVNREADLYDVLANSCGIIIALIAFPFIKKNILKK